ncbi:N-acetylmuramoyl-L-alanine amidase family protein [Megasphaera elsdenii]|uniref:N-acetylmuramoyl-L-alanine amidase family protein n=1 Tax=Megasphaera elsdenii TaxID=907 RepID=UPI00091ED717|nr:N-acetylmuramoyl-L-alanine amidase [Megasphaera elsdenii]SHK44645.1 N-acetylmuramoyl-L-alanine amidase [Megasphaera elsdenii]
MKVFLNPGHDTKYDSGAVHYDADGNVDLRECDVAAKIGTSVQKYLEAAGCECYLMQSDNLAPTSAGRSDYDDRQGITVTETANEWGADIFVSIHCNAANGQARGTEVECYSRMSDGGNLAQCIQDQIVGALGTIDRGVKEMPGLIVLKHTSMPAVLVETAFIDNDSDAALLENCTDAFAAAIARGVTDYECSLR